MINKRTECTKDYTARPVLSVLGPILSTKDPKFVSSVKGSNEITRSRHVLETNTITGV